MKMCKSRILFESIRKSCWKICWKICRFGNRSGVAGEVLEKSSREMDRLNFEVVRALNERVVEFIGEQFRDCASLVPRTLFSLFF
jgi:hypothetical protein